MNTWAAKRFYKAATVEAVDGGFGVALDGRSVRTPAKAPLVLPTRALAELIAAEWDAQSGTIKPDTMPATRMANVAIDKLAAAQAAVVDSIVEYGGSDLLCYRAPNEAALAARQAVAWDPVLAWASKRFGVRLHTTAGVIHVAQAEGDLARLRVPVSGFSPLRLAAFHELVALSGSLLLPLAFAEGELSGDEAWNRSRIDEDWQAEQWGPDDEAAETSLRKKTDFLLAAQFFNFAAENLT